jgi:glutamate 5-kinase
VDRRAHLQGVRRIVVKVGTNVLTRETGEMGLGRIHTLIEDLVDVRRRDLQVILVSSGAISMGMERLQITTRPQNLPDKQACAAVGQIRLMSVYEQAFNRFGIPMAQILLTEEDFANRVRYLNLRNTIRRLLELGVMPVINENDTVSTSEIENRVLGGLDSSVFGDNDRLSALVMSKLGADLLVLLSDVDGLYPWEADAQGGSPAAPQPLSVVRRITPEIEAMSREGNGRGRGGMLSKLRSIKVALEGGGLAVIANGTRSGILQQVLAGEEVGTLFLPRRKITSRKRWIAHASATRGKVLVNQGARDALVRRQSSLLFAGVTGLEAEFRRGDVVSVVLEGDREFARGIVNYSAEDARPLLGKRSSEVLEVPGMDYEELIHRDNIVLVD